MNSDNENPLDGKRITLKRSRPNSLLESWLEKLHSDAEAKNSKLEPKLKEALESLSKYPLPLKSGMECAVLKGFDKKMCQYFDKYLKEINQVCSQPSTSSTSSLNSQQKSDSSIISEDLVEESASNTSPLQNKSNIHSSSTSPDNTEIVKDQNLNTNHKKSNKKECPKKSRNRKEYKPVFRSGSYALLIALLEQVKQYPDKPSLKRNELIEKAQPYSEESFTRPKPNSFYTAWSNMKHLLAKGLIKQVRTNKVDYSLTTAGISLATELLEDAKNRPTVNDIIFNGASFSNSTKDGNEVTIPPTKVSDNNGHSVEDALSTKTNSIASNSQTSLSQNTVSDLTFVELLAGSFDVILLIDKQETGGVKNKKDPTVAQFNKYPDLKHEYRSLKVGDYTWVARHKVNTKEELVLPYIVERKRMDDFGHSIKDGRFHEQKFRLRKCGLTNVIYLVESYGSNNKHIGLPIQSLMQAIANTRVQDGFKVYNTNSLTETTRFLAMMTKRLTIEYKDKLLIGTSAQPQGEQLMTFSYFNKSSTKNKALTVTETFIKLLLQLKGVSVEKALAITKVYHTPKALINAYENCTQKEGESLLANLKYGNLNRNVGPMVSKTVNKFFVWRG